jgi:hypothetical protein
MVRASVEALRRVYDAWAQGDFSSRPEMLDPNIEGVWAAELPDAHVDQGVRGPLCVVARVAFRLGGVPPGSGSVPPS